MNANMIEGGKTFKAMNEDGECYTFRMHDGATDKDAKQYAALWNHLAGAKKRLVKVWEIQ